MNTTYLGLMMEFGTSQIPLEEVHEKYFSLSLTLAKSRANTNQLPVPAYKVGTQKSSWIIDAADLAALIDKNKAAATRDWNKMNGVRVA